MELINYGNINKNLEEIKSQWDDTNKPFKYLVFDDFFYPEKAELILNEYPSVTDGNWDGTTYVNQKNKFTLTQFGEDYPHLQQAFDELNGAKFIALLEKITAIKDITADNELFGGGLHQSVKGAFLDVHVDFNLHSKTKFHRRMNAIVYMNKNWEMDYNGYLELWDMKNKTQLEYISPSFNRLVMFETNEVSFHGHPKPLNTPPHVSRKSLAVYYYTKTRPKDEIAEEHNTIYVNTESTKGVIKNLNSGIKAAFERVLRKK